MEPTADDLPTEPTKRTPARLKLAVYFSMALTLAILLGWLIFLLVNGSLSLGSPEFNGIVMPEPEPAPDIRLTAHTGDQVSLSDFGDKLVLIYFGYTFCPDVCPATLIQLSRALDRLDPKDREQVQVIMISVDPARDTPQVLADYVTHFDPSFIGLTGSDDEIEAIADAYGIFVNKREGTVETGYQIDHTANINVIDRDGLLRLVFRFSTPAEEIASDLEQLLDS